MSGGRVKAIYVLVYMAFASWRVYYNVYLEEHDFSGVEIGTLNALIQATLFVIVPVWGVIADRRGIRPSLRMAIFVSGILLLYIGNVLSFWVLLIYIFLLTLFHHPIGPLIDALAVQVTQQSDKHNYGGLRLWGSLGWAIASIILAGGFLLLNIPLRIIFPVSSVLFFSAILFLGLPGKKNRVKYRPGFEKIHLHEITGNRALLIFLIILFLYGLASSPVNAYINLYFAELGANNAIIGMAYTIQALSELPFFIIGNKLLRRLGARWIILISMFIMIIRFLIYGLFPGVAMALIISVLQGITLSFLLVGVVDYLHSQLPPSRQATAQSLLWGLYFGLGHTVGNFIIGLLKDSLGMIGVMKVFMFITLGIFVLTIIDFLLNNKVLTEREGNNLTAE